MDPTVQLRQVLAQTPAVEALQENARRQGDREQQQVARLMKDRLELQGRQVEESPAVEALHNDPDEESAGRDRRRAAGARVDEADRADEADGAGPADADEDAERLGARLDRRA